MNNHIILDSCFGPLALTLDQVREARERASEMAVAVGSDSDGTKARPGAKNTASGESWLSVKEVAARTGLKPSWLYAEIRKNRLPSRQFGRLVRIPESYLDTPDRRSGSQTTGGQ